MWPERGAGPVNAADLTPEHIGCVVLGIPEVLGWERHLVLCDLQHGDTETYLGFRWNDDPSPSNTKRGEFAIGVKVSPGAVVEIHAATA